MKTDISYSMVLKYLLRSMFWAFVLSISFFACKEENKAPQNSYKNIEAAALDIIHKCIDAHGGLEKWKALTDMSYKKNFVLFDEAGAVERMVTQHHEYDLTTDKQYKIMWKENQDQDELALIFEKGQLHKTKNAKKQEADATALNNSLQSSLYVIGLPYKLLDDGPVITYEGLEKAWNGRDAHLIKAVYDPSKSKNLTTADVWWFLIDKENYRMIGNRISHLDHHNMIKNTSWNEVDGMLFYKERESRRIDEDGKDLYLRASYLYENISIK